MENTGVLTFFTLFTLLAPFLGWVLLTVVTGVAAYHRGRDVAVWTVLSFFVMGPFALICVLVMAKNQNELDQRALKNGTMKQCPDCAELIKPQAPKCRYCNTVEYRV